MPGAFAHMIAAEEARSLLEKRGFRLPTLVLNRFPQWMQAGTAGPDYPYLHHVLTSTDSSDNWADLLHYTRTGDVVRAGAAHLRAAFPASRDQESFQRALAWFYGYASHVVFDASIHPVVRAIVGEYENNKTEHRACEMFMDSWLYAEIYGIELTNSEWADYLRALTDQTTGQLDQDVANLWAAMLQTTYPDKFRTNPPQIHAWHRAYVDKLDAADVNVGFFRHLASKKGLVYIPSAKIKPADLKRYIQDAKLPAGNLFGREAMNYGEIFRFGVENVVRFWEEITRVIEGDGDPQLAGLPNWNLDKGTIDPEGTGDATLWV